MLNIEDKFLKSAAVLFESAEDGALFKFVAVDVSDKSEEWLNYKRFHSQDTCYWTPRTAPHGLNLSLDMNMIGGATVRRQASGARTARTRARLRCPTVRETREMLVVSHSDKSRLGRMVHRL